MSEEETTTLPNSRPRHWLQALALLARGRNYQQDTEHAGKMNADLETSTTYKLTTAFGKQNVHTTPDHQTLGKPIPLENLKFKEQL